MRHSHTHTVVFHLLLVPSNGSSTFNFHRKLKFVSNFCVFMLHVVELYVRITSLGFQTLSMQVSPSCIGFTKTLKKAQELKRQEFSVCVPLYHRGWQRQHKKKTSPNWTNTIYSRRMIAAHKINTSLRISKKSSILSCCIFVRLMG